MTPRRHRYWVIPLFLGVALALGGTLILADRWQVATAPPASTEVRRGDLTLFGSANGTVRPVARRDLGFLTDGTIVSLEVKPGDTVRTGQELAAVDPAAARNAVTDAETRLR